MTNYPLFGRNFAFASIEIVDKNKSKNRQATTRGYNLIAFEIENSAFF